MKHRSDLDIGRKPAPGDLVVVQGFVNTVDLETGRDKLSSTEGLRRWLVHHGLGAPDTSVGEGERVRVVAFREALRGLLFANHGEEVDPVALRVLNEAAVRAPLRVAFEGSGARLVSSASGVDAALATLTAVVYDAMRSGTFERLKACRNDVCGWAFYDASRNRSGAWCTMAVCGNRKKVEAYRRRAAEG